MKRLVLWVLVSLFISSPAHGEDNPVLQANIDAIASDKWTISGFEASVELTPSGLGGTVHITRIVMAESGQVFDDVRVDCALIGLTTRTVSCADATFTATLPGIGRQAMPGAFSYDRSSGGVEIALTNIAVAGGKVECEISALEGAVEARFTGTGMDLAGLVELGGQFSGAFAAYSAAGRVGISGTLSAPAGGPLTMSIAADFDQASIANEAGTVAADGFKGRIDIGLVREADATGFTFTVASNQGEAYLEPVYANFSDHAFRLHAEGEASPGFDVFNVRRFELDQATDIDADGSATLRFPADGESPIGVTADVAIHDASASYLYTSFIQVRLAGTMLGNLETDGRLSGSLSIVDNSPRSATLQLGDLVVDDQRGRFAIYGLNGLVDWRGDPGIIPAPSRIRWDSATFYNVTLGGGDIGVQLGDKDFELLAPLRLATLGGALLINQLVLQDFGTEGATGSLDAELEPVQLGQLTSAFGWPAFSGTLSGRLPLLQLKENTITVGGTLSARAFDGTAEISDLRIEQPFGLVPRLRANVSLRQLDLQRLTEVFSFGLIQGRLSGDISGLTMQNWSPVAMDMHFYTPPGDTSKHRISQRAVENLASVGGGGAAAALSTGFMKFFEVFAYDQIGLRCVLRNGNCAMSGAGPVKSGPLGQGYYIVKGKGVPRIDVVGYRDTVSWARLVQQLAAIARSGSATIG